MPDRYAPDGAGDTATTDTTDDDNADGSVAAGGTPPEDPDPSDVSPSVYQTVFDIEVGTTLVEDRATGTKQQMWRAHVTDRDGEATYYHVAESATAAVLGVIEHERGTEVF